MKKHLLLLMAIACVVVAEGKAGRGEIRMTMRDGGTSMELRFRYCGERLRIDRPGEIIPSPPVNLLDSGTGTLRILHPHNGTWEQAARSALECGDGVSAFGAATPPPATTTPAPRIDPPADWPEMPGMPKDLPQGIGPGAGTLQGMPSAGMGMPGFPAMPDFPMEGMEDKPMELVEQNQTQTLHGFTCMLYKTAIPGEEGTMELWLSDDPRLPAFHLLLHEIPRQYGRAEWDEQLARVLRKKKLFPFLAELKDEGGRTLVKWSVASIKTNVEEEEQEGIFGIPEGMHRME